MEACAHWCRTYLGDTDTDVRIMSIPQRIRQHNQPSAQSRIHSSIQSSNQPLQAANHSLKPHPITIAGVVSNARTNPNYQPYLIQIINHTWTDPNYQSITKIGKRNSHFPLQSLYRHTIKSTNRNVAFAVCSQDWLFHCVSSHPLSTNRETACTLIL